MMHRYFIEVAYKGKLYAGFQKQLNANTVQAEVEKVLSVFFKSSFYLTGASRTDAGVHALQNFFHFDAEAILDEQSMSKVIYHLNAMLPADIVVQGIHPMQPDAHCRFDAISRTYTYRVYQDKNPFLAEVAYYYPYALDITALNEAAKMLFDCSDFEAFSKRSTQVHTFLCEITDSRWSRDADILTYHVTANRFLRGMVRGLVGTMLQVGRGKLTPKEFGEIIAAKKSSRVNFAVPAHGLTLMEVKYRP